MVHNTHNYWGFDLFPSSGNVENRNMTFRKLDLFPSSSEGGRRHILIWAPSEKTYLSGWTLSKGLN
jgi:hypothetical protein